MNTEEQVNKSIWFVLRKIKAFSLGILAEPVEIRYKTEIFPKSCEAGECYDDELHVIDILTRFGAIKHTSQPLKSDGDAPLYPHHVIWTEYFFNLVQPKYNEFYEKYARLFQPIKKSELANLKCGDLQLNIKKATLQYKNNKEIGINPNTREIRFLKLLIERTGEVVEYIELAKNLALNCYHENVKNEDVYREVQDIKKELNKLLKSAGMSQQNIETIITTVRKSGYKLNRKQ